jgi:CRISPR-associated endonuclease/helicase Cas3
MKPLDATRFTEYYRALYGPDRKPFPWQLRLAKRVCEGRWPEAIALPTASGKSTCIDIAVFALACQADWKERTAPRRIIPVVDRRVIVDQVYQQAQHIAETLEQAKDGILWDVAERLRNLAHPKRSAEDEVRPLDCFQLRGGIYRDDAWARTPLQPTVIASTVDQVGSRLLYRGYGLRAKPVGPDQAAWFGPNWPIHAGLVANDSLIILDEAHCAEPFRQTADAVAGYRVWGAWEWHSPFQVVPMTATPAADARDVFYLEDKDRQPECLGKRLNCSKLARLVVAQKAKGKDAQKHLADEMVKQARGLMKGSVRAVGVIVNRVATAKMISGQLTEKEPGADVVLLTGRMRPIDRDQTVNGWITRLKSGKQQPLEKPLFVVATQCLEVGADLDFHAFVTECASLDALRQRFGRLNRLGERDKAEAVIVVRADQQEPADDPGREDPVYGPSLPETWRWLSTIAQDATVDMGIRALDEKVAALDREMLNQLNAPSPDAPVLLPSHLDCWVQTAPIPAPDPDPAVFLHGPQRSSPEVQVVWRADLPAEGTEDDWKEIISLCPPSSSEAMPVPLPAVRAWLAGDGQSPDFGDVEGSAARADEAVKGGEPRRAFRWCGPEDSTIVEDGRDIRPGDTLVIPLSLGGWEAFGHIPSACLAADKSPWDLGEYAFALSRGRALLRFTPAVIAQWPAKLQIDLTCLLEEELQLRKTEETPENLSDRLRGAVCEMAELREAPDRLKEVLNLVLEVIIAAHPLTPDWLSTAAKSLRDDLRRKDEAHPAGGLILRGVARREERSALSLAFTDEDDASSAIEFNEGAPLNAEERNGNSPTGIPLPDHCRGVERFAKFFAEACGLPSDVVSAITLAARWHDLGKADPRFQAWLLGGNRREVRTDRLLAKSARMPRSAKAMSEARERSGYPRGGRHELLSVRLAEARVERLPEEVDRDLFFHLIASHHGHCRPFAPALEDDGQMHTPAFDHLGEHFEPRSVITDLERIDSGVAERFWRLVRKYGWWGLAYLEVILRLADHCQSRSEQGDARTSREGRCATPSN